MHDKSQLLHPRFHPVKPFGGNHFFGFTLGVYPPDRRPVTGKFRRSVGQDVAVIGHCNGGKRHTMRRIGVRGDSLSEHVHHPVGGFALGNKGVERPRCRPHDIGTRLVIGRIHGGDICAVNQ